MIDRYIAHGVETEFEPGSNEEVLENRLGRDVENDEE